MQKRGLQVWEEDDYHHTQSGALTHCSPWSSFLDAELVQSVSAKWTGTQACSTRDSTAVHRTPMCPWRSRLAEHLFACPRQCVSACVVCSWQTYSTSVKKRVATWNPVNSMYPSSLVHHSSSLTIAQRPASEHAVPYACCFSGKHCPMMDSWGFELQHCAVTVTIIHTLEDWRVIELWPLMKSLHLAALVHICIL